MLIRPTAQESPISATFTDVEECENGRALVNSHRIPIMVV